MAQKQRNFPAKLPLVVACIFPLFLIFLLRGPDFRAWAEPPSANQPNDNFGDWPMFRGGHDLTGVARCSLPSQPALLWKITVGDVVASSAAIVDGIVYVGCDSGTLFALNLSNGATRWQYQTSPSTSQPASTTQPSRPGIQSSPTIHKDLVLFGDQDGTFHALSKANGKPRWSNAIGGEIISSANCTDDRCVFGSYDGSLYCLSLSEGKQLWKLETEGKVHGTPAIWNGHAIAAGCDGQMHIVNLTDGKEVAAADLGGYSGGSAAILGKRAFVGTFSNQVVGVDLVEGKPLWNYENPERQFPFYASAAVTQGHVIIGGRDKTVHCLDPESGKAIWTFKTKGRVEASPVIVGERVFVASSDGNLYALEIKGGKEVWRYEVGSPMTASPAVGQGRLVIGTEDGGILCFGENAADVKK